MKEVFNYYNIPCSARNLIFSYLVMRDEYNKVIHDIDIGNHKKEISMGVVSTGILNHWGKQSKYRRIVAAQDIYTLAYPTLQNPSQYKITVCLSERYSYTPPGWPNTKSRSEPPNITCPLCYDRMRYKDNERRNLTTCECIYDSIIWREAKERTTINI